MAKFKDRHNRNNVPMYDEFMGPVTDVQDHAVNTVQHPHGNHSMGSPVTQAPNPNDFMANTTNPMFGALG